MYMARRCVCGQKVCVCTSPEGVCVARRCMCVARRLCEARMCVWALLVDICILLTYCIEMLFECLSKSYVQ